jgi:hypothetical protein
MKDVLVASVFASSPRNETWLHLQRSFLRQTTASYDHAVYLNHCDWSDSFRESLIIGSRSEKTRTGPGKQSADHAAALTEVFRYFRDHPDYSYYLLLDSDCFPVRRGWLRLLVRRMKRFQFAAPIRSENLEDFPHPCALFLTKAALERPWNLAVTPGRNLLGKPFVDLGCSLPTEGWYPLLRTNVYNPHPVLAAIYKHLFYHHGAGSRQLYFRAERYYDHIDDHARVEAEIYARLVADPAKFISDLMGGDGLAPAPTSTLPAHGPTRGGGEQAPA